MNDDRQPRHYSGPPNVSLPKGRRWEVCHHPECIADRQRRAAAALNAGRPAIDPGWYTSTGTKPERLCSDHRQTATADERAAVTS